MRSKAHESLFKLSQSFGHTKNHDCLKSHVFERLVQVLKIIYPFFIGQVKNALVESIIQIVQRIERYELAAIQLDTLHVEHVLFRMVFYHSAKFVKHKVCDALQTTEIYNVGRQTIIDQLQVTKKQKCGKLDSRKRRGITTSLSLVKSISFLSTTFSFFISTRTHCLDIAVSFESDESSGTCTGIFLLDLKTAGFLSKSDKKLKNLFERFFHALKQLTFATRVIVRHRFLFEILGKL
jgi:hypothetical protein